MTAEEILELECDKTGTLLHTDKPSNVSIIDGDATAVFNAMGIYAKQDAIEFAEWILSESILPRDTVWFDAGKLHTSENLYQQYLQSLNTNK